MSERRACKVLGQARAVQRHTPRVRDDEDRLTGRIVELAAVYGRYGTPRIGALLRHEGWRVSHIQHSSLVPAADVGYLDATSCRHRVQRELCEAT